jgi:hypothetical protein
METILSHEGTKTRRGEEGSQKEKEDLDFWDLEFENLRFKI